MECDCDVRNIHDLVSDGKTPYEKRFGMPFNGPVIPIGAMVEDHTISVKKTYRDSINLVQKSWPSIIWKNDMLVKDMRQLEKMDASEIHAKRLNAKEMFTPQKGENKFPVADGTVKLSGGDQVLRTSHLNPGQTEERRVRYVDRLRQVHDFG